MNIEYTVFKLHTDLNLALHDPLYYLSKFKSHWSLKMCNTIKISTNIFLSTTM